MKKISQDKKNCKIKKLRKKRKKIIMIKIVW